MLRIIRYQKYILGSLAFITVILFLLLLNTRPQRHIYAQTAGTCGTICDATHSCGSPVTITGKIVDQNGTGVSGLLVILYNHNRDNSNYPNATITVTTDANGNFQDNTFICGQPSINYGDAYAVRPNWTTCAPGFSCSNPRPPSFENQQALKLGTPDCGVNGGCNFTVILTPISTNSNPSNPSNPTLPENSPLSYTPADSVRETTFIIGAIVITGLLISYL